MTGAQSFSALSNAVPFYAPPSQEELDAKGKKIDCICEPKKGDCWVAPAGHICYDHDGTVQASYSGLRYILKDKATKPETEIDLLKRAIKLMEAEDES